MEAIPPLHGTVADEHPSMRVHSGGRQAGWGRPHVPTLVASLNSIIRGASRVGSASELHSLERVGRDARPLPQQPAELGADAKGPSPGGATQKACAPKANSKRMRELIALYEQQQQQQQQQRGLSSSIAKPSDAPHPSVRPLPSEALEPWQRAGSAAAEAAASIGEQLAAAAPLPSDALAPWQDAAAAAAAAAEEEQQHGDLAASGRRSSSRLRELILLFEQARQAAEAEAAQPAVKPRGKRQPQHLSSISVHVDALGSPAVECRTPDAEESKAAVASRQPSAVAELAAATLAGRELGTEEAQQQAEAEAEACSVARALHDAFLEYGKDWVATEYNRYDTTFLLEGVRWLAANPATAALLKEVTAKAGVLVRSGRAAAEERPAWLSSFRPEEDEHAWSWGKAASRGV